jgi:hypothetical protein
MTALRVRFARPAKLGPDAALALEDYARASSSFPASIVLDGSDQVEGLSFDGDARLPEGVASDIERFFDSLTADAADRLGWS